MPVDIVGQIVTRGIGADYTGGLLAQGFGDWSGYSSITPLQNAGRVMTRGLGCEERPYLLTRGMGEFADERMDAGRVLTRGVGDRAAFLLTRGHGYEPGPSSGRGLPGRRWWRW